VCAGETVDQFAATLSAVLRVPYGRITLHYEASRIVMITTETRHKPFEIAALLNRRFAPRSPGERE
jgi:hypothetical protein